MSLSYEFSIGSVRAKEKHLLTASDLENMLGFEAESKLCGYLSDKGFGDGGNIDEIIESHRRKSEKYLRVTAPDFGIFAPFVYLNDLHNLKAALKGTLSGRAYDGLLIKPRTFSPDTLKAAVENRKFSLLGEELAREADKAYEILAHTGDARLSDAVLDAAFASLALETARGADNEFIGEYFNAMFFYSNVKTAIRGAKIGCGRDFFKTAFCKGVEGFPYDKIIEAAAKGTEQLLDVLSKTSACDCSKATEAYKASPRKFERYAENRLMSLARQRCKIGGSGSEPLIGYLIAVKAEEKAVHIIANGIRTKASPDKVRERLREIYG